MQTHPKLLPQQLIFDWTRDLVPAFDNFLPGHNVEVVAHLQKFADGVFSTPSVLLWGAPGSGKTHLLKATIARALDGGRGATLISETSIPDDADRGILYAIDDVDRLVADAQGRLFTLYNRCRDAGAQLLLAGAVPAARAPLRDDLRTRIGAGLILEVVALADADKPAALAAYANEHGFTLPTEVIDFLLTRGRRDMTALIAHLRALDRYSLATKRHVTVPLVKELLGTSLTIEAERPPDVSGGQ